MHGKAAKAARESGDGRMNRQTEIHDARRTNSDCGESKFETENSKG
jgi:hypothetical protein